MDDLIRRDDALHAIAQYCVGCESCSGVRCKGCQIDDAIRAVEDCEEVDAEPVRHSKWVCSTPGVFSCGACLWLALGNRTTRYCHNCGAKMDGGDCDG